MDSGCSAAAAAAGNVLLLDPSRLTITALRPGSVVLDFTIVGLAAVDAHARLSKTPLDSHAIGLAANIVALPPPPPPPPPFLSLLLLLLRCEIMQRSVRKAVALCPHLHRRRQAANRLSRRVSSLWLDVSRRRMRLMRMQMKMLPLLPQEEAMTEPE